MPPLHEREGLDLPFLRLPGFLSDLFGTSRSGGATVRKGKGKPAGPKRAVPAHDIRFQGYPDFESGIARAYVHRAHRRTPRDIAHAVTVEGARLMPRRFLPVPPFEAAADPEWPFMGGVYDRHGFYVPISGRQIVPAQPLPDPVSPERFPEARWLPGESVYGGIAYFDFGHILIESIGRLWAHGGAADSRPLVVYPDPAMVEMPALYAKTLGPFLRPLGIDPARVVLVTEPLCCERLIVPNNRFVLESHARANAAEIHRRIARGLAPFPHHHGEKVFLSRSRVRSLRQVPGNEAELEARMAALGFAIVHPQELPLADQIGLARHARIIAGLDGSALHLGLFARPGTMVISFDNRLNANQFAVEAAAGLRGRHVWIGRSDRPGWTIDVEAAVAFARDCLDEGVPAVGPDQPRPI